MTTPEHHAFREAIKAALGPTRTSEHDTDDDIVAAVVLLVSQCGTLEVRCDEACDDRDVLHGAIDALAAIARRVQRGEQ